jgi:hypothetical protein
MKTQKAFVAGFVLGFALGAVTFVRAMDCNEAMKWANDFWTHHNNPSYWPDKREFLREDYQDWRRYER